MSGNLAELESIINEELRIFTQILRLEQEKSDAIINKDGALMQKLSQDQEQYLSKITPVENKRKQFIDIYQKKNNQDLTLKDIASLEGVPGNSLAKTGEEFKRILLQLKKLQETNTKMIKDNIEFFNHMINQIKHHAAPETGYSKNGKEKSKSADPLLVDKKI